MSIAHRFNYETKTLTIQTPDRFTFDVHKSFREIADNIPPAAKHIVCDLHSTTYMDSSALAMLLLIRDKAIANKQTVTLSNLQPYPKKLVAVARFEDLFIVT